MNNFFFVSISLLILLIVIFRKSICEKLKLIDYPGQSRKLHKKPILLINGFILLVSLNYFFIFEILNSNPIDLKQKIIILIFINYFYFIGYLDDVRNLSPSIKTFLIFLILLLVLPLEKNLVLNSLQFKNFLTKEIILYQSSIFVTIFFIYIFFNFLNFADGANGIALSLCLFFLISIIIKKSFLSPFDIYFFLILLLCLIINVLNISFLGNSGVFLLSIIFSTNFIYEYNVNKLFLCDELFAIFLLPGMDMTRLVIERLLNRKNIYDGDRNHYHHLLLKFFKEKYIFIIYTFIAVIPYLFSYIINDYKIIIFIGIILYLISLFFLKGKFKKIHF